MTISEYETMLNDTVTRFRCYSCIESAANIKFVIRDGLGVSGVCNGCDTDRFMLPVRVDRGAV